MDIMAGAATIIKIKEYFKSLNDLIIDGKNELDKIKLMEIITNIQQEFLTLQQEQYNLLHEKEGLYKKLDEQNEFKNFLQEFEKIEKKDFNNNSFMVYQHKTNKVEYLCVQCIVNKKIVYLEITRDGLRCTGCGKWHQTSTTFVPLMKVTL